VGARERAGAVRQDAGDALDPHPASASGRIQSAANPLNPSQSLSIPLNHAQSPNSQPFTLTLNSLKKQGITHILNMSDYEDCPTAYAPSDFDYLILNVPDQLEIRCVRTVIPPRHSDRSCAQMCSIQIRSDASAQTL
jgi:hypothetical protein